MKLGSGIKRSAGGCPSPCFCESEAGGEHQGNILRVRGRGRVRVGVHVRPLRDCGMNQARVYHILTQDSVIALVLHAGLRVRVTQGQVRVTLEVGIELLWLLS